MSTLQKYEDFFKHCPNPTSELKEKFNENTKNIVCRIKEDGEKMSWLEFEILFNKQKDNAIIRAELVRCQYLPIPFRDIILDKELKRPDADKSVCFELLKWYIPSPAKIKKLAQIVGDELLEREFQKAFEENRNTVIHQDTVRELQNIFPEKYSGYHFCHSLVSSSLLSTLAYSNKNNEQIITAICNNRYMKDMHKNKFFDLGCDFENITNPTEYMIRQIYTSCVETIFDIDNKSGDIEQLREDAFKTLYKLINKDWLDVDLQIDLSNRAINSEVLEKSNKYALQAMNVLGIKSKYDNVLELIAPYTDAVLQNIHTPYKIIKKRINKLTEEIINGSTPDYRKSILMHEGNKMGFNDECCEKIINNTFIDVYENLALSENVSIKILEQLKSKKLSDRIKHICNMNIKLKQSSINAENQPHIFKFLKNESAIFNINSDTDIGIKLKTDEYNKLHEIVKNEYDMCDTETSKQNIESLLKEIESAYIYRDLSVDFPEYYTFVKNVCSIPPAHCPSMIVLKPYLSENEISTFLNGVNHPDALMSTVDEIYYVLDILNKNDSASFYEVLDYYIDLVGKIKNRQRELATEFNQEDIQFEER